MAMNLSVSSLAAMAWTPNDTIYYAQLAGEMRLEVQDVPTLPVESTRNAAVMRNERLPDFRYGNGDQAIYCFF